MSLILLVDDMDDSRQLVSHILRIQGYHVIEASNGRDAVNAAFTHQPDLILMDLSMPIMDGWTATAKIKAEPHFQHTPVIAFTAHAMGEDPYRALAVGCDGYLSKPVVLSELLALLQGYLHLQAA